MKTRSICARCGWHWFKHGAKNQCPNTKPNPDGSKPRYLKRTGK